MTEDRDEIEERRLQAVQSLEILDTPPESDFDDIVRLAMKVFKVPISAVTILDAHRQWFKSVRGFNERETPREISFCTHTIKQSVPFIVENAKTDPRFSQSPLVTGSPHVSFYAGVPLLNSEKLAVGAFCIMDNMPRALSAEEVDILQTLANQVMTLLELRRERNWLRQLLSELDRIYKTLRESEQRWSFALEGAGDGVWDWKVGTDTAFLSKRWKAMLGYGENEFPNSLVAWQQIIHPEDFGKVMSGMQAHLDGDAESFNAEYRICRKDGGWLWVLTRGLVVERDNAGKPLRMVGTNTDITERKQNEELIWRQANFDTLTGLPNRRMFFDRLAQEIARATRGQQMFAVLFIDLDGFKQVNDLLGHRAGDAVLIEASRRLAGCIRKSDTLARLGGDEFIVIFSALKQQSSVERISDKILKVISRPFNVMGKQVELSASIGIAMFPEHGLDGDSLISRADTAMYDAKEIGKNCWVIYEPRSTEAEPAA